MATIGERLARIEERLSSALTQLNELEVEGRAVRGRIGQLERREERDRAAGRAVAKAATADLVADARRERRLLAMFGLLLTATNVAIAAFALYMGSS